MFNRNSHSNQNERSKAYKRERSGDKNERDNNSCKKFKQADSSQSSTQADKLLKHACEFVWRGDKNDIKKFFNQSFNYLKDERCPGNSLKYILILLERNHQNIDNSWNSFAQCLPALIEYSCSTQEKENSYKNAEYSATILNKLGHFTKKLPFLLKHLQANSISILVASLLSSAKIEPRLIGNSVWAFGKFAEYLETRGLLKTIHPTAIAALVDKLASDPQANSQERANAVWALGKCAAHPETLGLLKDIHPTAIAALVDKLANDLRANSQDRANAVWAFGKCAEYPETLGLLKTIHSKDIATLMGKIASDPRANSQERANAIWALGKCADHPETRGLLKDIHPTAIAALVNKLANDPQANSQERANAVWALGKCAAHPETLDLLKAIHSTDIAALVDKLANDLRANSQDRANAVWAIGKCAEYPETLGLLKTIHPTAIAALVDKLANDPRAISQHRANAVWAIGKCADHPETRGLLKTIDSTDAATLLSQLASDPQATSQERANAVWALGKCAAHLETRGLLKDIHPTAIAALVDKLANDPQANSQDRANAVWALGKCAARPEMLGLLKAIHPAAIIALVGKLANDPQANSQDRANALWALGKCAAHLETRGLLKAIHPASIAALMGKIASDPQANSQHRANAVWALGKLASYPDLPGLFEKIKYGVIKNLIRKLVEDKEANFFDCVSILLGVNSFIKNLAGFTLEPNDTRQIGDLANRHFKQQYYLFHRRYKISPLFLGRLIDTLEQLLGIAEKISEFILPDLNKWVCLCINQLFQRRLNLNYQTRLSRVWQQWQTLTDTNTTQKADCFSTDTDISLDNNIVNKQMSIPHKPFIIAENPDKLYISPILFPEIYSIKNDDHIQKLMKDKGNKFKYNTEFNKNRTKIKLFISPVTALNGELGVFAGEKLEPSKQTIGCYAGERLLLDQENGDSHYIFEVRSPEGEMIHVIDADKTRDWTAFLNHSTLANISVAQKTVKNETNIYFYVKKTIYEGEQLLFDYGAGYFRALNIKPFYLHPQDNALRPHEIYQKFQPYYENKIFSFDTKTAKLWNLEFSQWLFPNLFIPIIANDVKMLENLLNKKQPIDLPAYALCWHASSMNIDLNSEEEQVFTPPQRKLIEDPAKQPHITALMLACYLGNVECIQLLLKHQANPDRCMRQTGYNPLLILLMNPTVEANILQEVGMALLEKMAYPFLADHDQLSLLHYIIKRNAIGLVDYLLQKAVEEQHDLFDIIFNRDKSLPPHADLDECLLNSQFDIVEKILPYLTKTAVFFEGDFSQYLNEDLVFRTETVSKLSYKNLKSFEKILTALYPHWQYTTLNERVQNAKKIQMENDKPIISNNPNNFFNLGKNKNDELPKLVNSSPASINFH